jgi:CHAT domain-containing protein/Tfp pilus assembly protein PilF
MLEQMSNSGLSGGQHITVAFVSYVCMVFLGFLPCTVPLFAQNPSDTFPPVKLVVLDVTSGSESAKAGIHLGDVLVSWARGDMGGQFRGPFELSLLETEEAPRGALTIRGFRGESEQTWILHQTSANSNALIPWGIVTSQVLSPGVVDSYREGGDLFGKGKFAEAASLWESAAANLPGGDSLLLESLASDAFARARAWTDCDRAHTVALQNSSAAFGGALALERNWADAYYRSSVWDQAESHYQRALAEAARLDSSLMEAKISRDIGTLFIDRGQPQKGEAYIRRSLEVQEQLAPDSFAVASSQEGLGRAFRRMGNLKESERYHREALRIRESLESEGLGVAASLINLGVVTSEQGYKELAEGYYRRSMEILGKIEPGGTLWAAASNNLSGLELMRGDFAAAEQDMRQALVIRRKLQPNSIEVATTLNNLGGLHLDRGDLSQAADDYSEALVLYEKLNPMTSVVASTLRHLGLVAANRGDWPLATSYFQRALAIWRRTSPDETHFTNVLVDLGEALAKTGNPAQAKQYYREALEVLERLESQPKAPLSVVRELAMIYESLDQPEQAVREFTKSLATLNQEVPGSLSTALDAFHLAGIYQRQGQWGMAERFYRQSLSIRDRLAANTAEQAESLYGLAEVARHNGEPAKAITLLEKALDALDEQTRRMGGSEEDHASFRGRFVSCYRNLVDLLVSQDRLAEAFHIVERSRARALLDLLAQRDLVFADVPHDLDRERRANSAEYDQVQGKIATLSPQKDGPGIADLQSRLLQLNADRAHIIDRIRAASPRFAALQYPVPLTLDTARTALDPGTALVSFVVGPDHTLLFVVKPSDAAPALSVFTISIGEAELRARVQRFGEAIKDRTPAGQMALARDARELYDLLLRPAEPLLDQCDRLLLVPDGPLYVLPFAALLRREHQFVIEGKPLHTTLSVTLYAELKKQRRAPEAYKIALAAFGDPAYGVATSKDSEGNREVHSVLSRGGGLRQLPFSRTEVQEIVALYPQRNEVYLGAQATEEHAKAIGTDVRFLHFAVHGLLDERFPLNSALALTIPKVLGEGQDNGLLQAWELYEGVRWDADLVVLSACDSGLGQEVVGEGLMGLTRAVHYAGARSVLASLWSVDDRRTEQLMRAFYQHLRGGESKDQALRAAQLELIQSRAASSPFYWAGFSLSGDWK